MKVNKIVQFLILGLYYFVIGMNQKYFFKNTQGADYYMSKYALLMTQ